jgi:hypothetical protein
MVSVAVSLPSLPVLLFFPRTLIDGADILGLGDIVLPGLVLSYLYVFDMRNFQGSLSPSRWPLWRLFVERTGYFWPAMGGYFVGLESALLAITISHSGQPALLYLVPGIFIPTLLLAFYRGHFKELWKNRLLSPPDYLIVSNSDPDVQQHHDDEIQNDDEQLIERESVEEQDHHDPPPLFDE